MTTFRPPFLLLLGLSLATPALAAEPPLAFGFVRASAGSFDSAPPFFDQGFGKLLDGNRPGDGQAAGGTGEARLALDWAPATGWGLFVHGTARWDDASQAAWDGSGLLEAFLERRIESAGGQQWAFRAGQFFLPTSRENTGMLWTSPYTLTLSALNSWVAEEVRPIGVDASWGYTFFNQHRLLVAGTVFGGNDTAGTLVAWRGFSFHDRPTPTGRFVPLPPFAGLPVQFPDQTRRGTRPSGSDLDGRPGYSGRVRWSAPEGRGLLQVTGFANRGDRALHGSEYAWETDFLWVSTEAGLPAGFRLLGEWGTGSSAMGFAPPGERSDAVVDLRFETYYLMLTREWGIWRTTARHDRFQVRDRDSTALDLNGETGRAWTFAVIAQLDEHWRAGIEVLDVTADRPEARRAGGPELDGDSVRAEVRYAF